MLPCVLHEDDDLLVVHKPAGLNTHAPAPYAGEGLYDWLRHREPRWAGLAIIHRLDKETSGVLVFGKTVAANRSLTVQFAERQVRKRYLLWTDRPVPQGRLRVVSSLQRTGARYVSRPPHAGADIAETWFEFVRREDDRFLVAAEPVTGRTHQIRAHAADRGFPVLGDTLYGGTPFTRVCLHAAELTLRHPADNRQITFHAPADFAEDTRQALRRAILDPDETNAFRLVHGAADGWPGWYVDRLGDFLLSQSERTLTPAQSTALASYLGSLGCQGAYHKILTRHVRTHGPTTVSPRHILGEPAPPEVLIRENTLRFALRLTEGYSVGLFLDQRDNRRRCLTNHVAAGFPLFRADAKARAVLNTFAYTCGFSVCAAKAGARVTSLDLSRKYLDWGRHNLELNGMDPAAHDFLYGDAFDWCRRLTRKGRLFEVILLDPPTFSQSKAEGVFRAEADLGRLVGVALPLLAPGGVLFVSTNAATLEPARFLATTHQAISAAGRRIASQHYAPQPPDFPVHRSEPVYLKTMWLRIE